MNIGIDGRALIEKKTGIGIYIENLLDSILQVDKSNNYYIFSDRKIYFNEKGYKNVYLIEYNSGFFLKKTLGYYFRLGHKIRNLKIHLDVFWGTQHILPRDLDKNVYKVLTMLDLVYYEFPQTTTFYNLLISRLFIPPSIKTSNRITSISNSTMNGIQKHLYKQARNKKIDVIYLGADCIEVDSDKLDKFYARYSHMPFVRGKNYLLYVGTIEPRKNIDMLLKAYESIREKANIKLVICGKVGWKCNQTLNNINDHKYKDDIFYIDYVTNEDKFLLMHNAFAFVFPSYYEGFGLPVVEAMKMGTIALTTKSYSLNELIEKEELKFDAYNPEELKDKILNLYQDADLYNQCKEYCMERKDDFSWIETAEEYIRIFNYQI